MRHDRLHRLLPLAGALFSLIMIAGLFLTRGEPEAGDPAATIFAYWHDHRGVQLISSLLLIPYGAVALLVFVGVLRRTLDVREGGSAYASVAFAGGIVAAAGLLLTGMLDAAIASSAHRDAEAAVYTLAQLQSYDWVPWIAGFAAMLLGSGAGALRTGALPKAIAWGAIVLGIAFLTPLGFFALFVFPAWALATSVVLFRAGPGTDAVAALGGRRSDTVGDQLGRSDRREYGSVARPPSRPCTSSCSSSRS
jgi:hypothetical protein